MLHRVSHTTWRGTWEPTSIRLLSTTLYSSFRVSPLCRQPFPSHRQPDLIPIDKYLTLKHGYDRNGGVPILDTYRIWVRVKQELSTYLFFFPALDHLWYGSVRLGTLQKKLSRQRRCRKDVIKDAATEISETKMEWWRFGPWRRQWLVKFINSRQVILGVI